VTAPSARAPLLREEVFEQYEQRLWGELILVQPVAIRVLGGALAALLCAAALLVSRAQYARSEKVLGYLAPQSGVS
jgi:hypothetical protein